MIPPAATADLPAQAPSAIVAGVMGSGNPPPYDAEAATDADLALRIAEQTPGQAQHEEAVLCHRFAPRVRQYGLRHLRNDSAAADLTQRVLLTTLEKLRAGEVREPARIASFVLGTARHMAQEMRRNRELSVGLEAEHFERAAGSGLERPRWTEGSSSRFDAERLARCMEGLSERERTVTVLTYYREQSAAEIAEALALQEGNVRVVRHRALERLRRCLGRRESQVDV